MRVVFLCWCTMTAASIWAMPAHADETEACAHFRWDVSHELAVMKQRPTTLVAATQAAADIPRLEVDRLYQLQLAPQSAVRFAAKPAKPTLDDGAQGGLARFRLGKPGVYRIAITSGHWIDVVAGDQLVKSRDFQGARGCARPHKIVEFELPANQDLLLQLSGSTDSPVELAITPVRADPSTSTASPRPPGH